MNVLFVTNYFGLHGSAISLLSLSSELKKHGHCIFFMGGDGDLRNRFEDIAENIYVIRNRKALPSLKKILLLYKLIKQNNVDVIIGMGKFIALECQFASLIFKRIQSITMMNFTPWQKHPQWHIPIVGFLAVICQFYKDRSIELYHWPEHHIHLLSARYTIPDTLKRINYTQQDRKTILIMSRLDVTKYQMVIRSLEQLGEWGILESWSTKVVGGGTHEALIQQKIDEMKFHFPEADIAWLGPTKNAMDLMAKIDLVVGSERIAVEGMIQGCLTLLASNSGLIDLITPDNIEKYSYDNFLSYNYSPLTSLAIRDKLFSALSDKKKFQDIVQGNFKYAKAHFDVKTGGKVLDNLIRESTACPFSHGGVVSGVWKIFISWAELYLYLIKDKISSLIMKEV